jgi:hypothetical protein
MYAEVVDLTPVLAMMNEHADQRLPSSRWNTATNT